MCVVLLSLSDHSSFWLAGDNMLTAISVGRQCGMVQGKERVILANAFPPEGDRTARIHWEDADQDADLPSTIPSENGTQEVSQPEVIVRVHLTDYQGECHRADRVGAGKKRRRPCHPIQPHV